MVLFYIFGSLTTVMLGASVALDADPPRRLPGAGAGQAVQEGGPRGRVGRDRMRGESDGQPESLDEVDGSNERPPFQWRRLPQPEREKLKRFIEEHFPRLALELDKLRERAPRRFEQRMTRIGPEMQRLMEMTERDPQRGLMMIRERQIAMQLHQLRTEYHQSSDDARRAELREKIQDVVAQEFKTRMGRRAAEVRQMETKLAELKARLSEMSSLREDIISRRVRELLEKRPPVPPTDRPDNPDDPDGRLPPGPGDGRRPPELEP